VLRRRVRRLHALPCRLGDLAHDLLLESFDLLGAEHALFEQALLEALQAVVLRELVDLLLGSIAALVVLRRMRPEAVDQAFAERRALAGACPRHRLRRPRRSWSSRPCRCRPSSAHTRRPRRAPSASPPASRRR